MIFIGHVIDFLKGFSNYFKEADVSEPEWLRNPFAGNSIGNFFDEQVIDMWWSDPENLPQCLLWMSKEYLSLSDKAVNILLPFVMCMWNQIFCCCCYWGKILFEIESKREKEELQVAVTSMAQLFKELYAKKQALPTLRNCSKWLGFCNFIISVM
jgi:hypothetical protein